MAVASLLKLLIMDEIHLLNDERGAVIETLVARTHRQARAAPCACAGASTLCALLVGLCVVRALRTPGGGLQLLRCCALCTVHCALCTVHSELCTEH